MNGCNGFVFAIIRRCASHFCVSFGSRRALLCDSPSLLVSFLCVDAPSILPNTWSRPLCLFLRFVFFCVFRGGYPCVVSSDRQHEFEWNVKTHIENQMTIEEYMRHVRIKAFKTDRMKQNCRNNIQPILDAMKGQQPNSGAKMHSIMHATKVWNDIVEVQVCVCLSLELCFLQVRGASFHNNDNEKRDWIEK